MGQNSSWRKNWLGCATKFCQRRQIYRQLLQTELIPYARQRFRRNVLLQHDNAPPHRARVVQDFLRQQQIDQLPWPAFPPDCNPIEHAWDALDRAVRSCDVQPSNLDELHCRKNGVISVSGALTSWLKVCLDVYRP